MSRHVLGLALAAAALAGSARAAPVVQLTQPPRHSAGAASLPRIASPATPATAKINAGLARIDARWVRAARECLGHAKPADAEMNRTVAAPMLGPRYLSIVAHDNAACENAAHPDAWVLALTYDLDTGSPVTWGRLLGPKLVEASAIDTAGDGSTVGVVSSGALHDLYVKAESGDQDPATRAQCADVLEDETMQFQLWLDAAKGGLVVSPSSLPHAVAACGGDAVIPVATLRRLGADPALLAALEAARKSGR